MKAPKTQLFIEFKEASVHLLDGAEGADFPLEREPAGRITPGSAAMLTNAIRGFLQRHGAVGTRQAICALPARGVTLRTITLPPAVKAEDLKPLLTMQIEAQFPVAPNELAWGYSSLANRPDGNNGGPLSNGQPAFLVTAVKRDLVQEYTNLLAGCGVTPIFTVAALARLALVAGSGSGHGILEAGTERSELIISDDSGAPSLRVLNWGRKQSDDPESLRAVLANTAAPLIYLSGAQMSPEAVVISLSSSRRAEVLPVPQAEGVTAATHGLRKMAEQGRAVLQLGAAEGTLEKFSRPRHWKWPAAAAVLVLIALALRYADAMLLQGQARAKLEQVTTYRTNTLPNLEQEVTFLNFIKTNQPPYLDTVAVISSAAPPGTLLDQLSIMRRGEVSLRGSIQNPQGPETFRSKLIDSGFFSKVVVEEQAPASQQDRNRISFRITAVLKPEETRKVLPPEPPLTNRTSETASPFPGGMPGPPPGMPLPDMPPPGAMPPGITLPPGARPMPSGAMPQNIILPDSMPPGVVRIE